MKVPRSLELLVLLVWASGHCVYGSKLLFVAPIGTKSQISFIGEIIKTMVDRGHQATFLTSYPGPKHPNVTEIDAKVPVLEHMPNIFRNRHRATLNKLDLIIPKLCLKSLEQKAFRELNIEEFDLIYLFAIRNGNDCFLLKLQNSQVPLILVTPVQLDLHLHEIIGDVAFPSFVTALGQTEWHPMSFVRRARNMVATAQVYITTKWEFIPRIEQQCKETGQCGEDQMPVEDVARKASFVFVNSVRSLESPPRPHVPGVVHLGCLNCRPSLPLSQDLESWVAGAGEAGFIYMSLGTVVKPSDMPDRSRRILLQVFGALQQRVLWKWDAPSMEGLPPNVRIVQWAPQQDILGHPRLQFFITQGGVFSTGEATFHGVPVLGMPVFFDQNTNINRIVKEGWGEAVEWDELADHHILAGKIQRLLQDKSYRRKAQQRSVLMRDQPMSPQGTVAYWSEYAIRHQGAPHLHSPVKDMHWYEVYNVDIWAAVVVAAAVSILLLAWLLLAVWRIITRLAARKLSATKPKTRKLRRD